MMSADSEDSFSTTRQLVSDWLLADGWTLSETPSPVPESAWLMQAVDPSGRTVILGQRTKRPDLIVLQGSVSLDERHSKKLEAMDSKEQEDLCWDLRLKLLEMVDFNGVSTPLRRVNLMTRVFTEHLRRQEFFQTLGQLQRAILVVVWTVRRALDQPAPDDVVVGEIN